ncbi:hypothetical protein GGTG_05407 [Gaeumannomyces tritici R3-111a-1]|uniref:Uncharacterized protein n=1 Tax=Gaeumannomyces tritici (strain R3-111a-1) TaxID=644352 RepID=J3NVU5_GAET3|nr:hypothetical protein GGTG_05407 [Gaeumannomyces tritici R3-111a-1]EJT75474.1 hypothetical protein GGTG_05407 [Gaeumannomyces tritici R3-111a-1]
MFALAFLDTVLSVKGWRLEQKGVLAAGRVHLALIITTHDAIKGGVKAWSNGTMGASIPARMLPGGHMATEQRAGQVVALGLRVKYEWTGIERSLGSRGRQSALAQPAPNRLDGTQLSLLAFLPPEPSSPLRKQCHNDGSKTNRQSARPLNLSEPAREASAPPSTKIPGACPAGAGPERIVWWHRIACCRLAGSKQASEDPVAQTQAEPQPADPASADTSHRRCQLLLRGQAAT